MVNSVNPDQTDPIRAICSGSTLFASILNSSVMLGNYLQLFAADDFSQMHFLLGVLRVNIFLLTLCKMWIGLDRECFFGPHMILISA